MKDLAKLLTGARTANVIAGAVRLRRQAFAGGIDLNNASTSLWTFTAAQLRDQVASIDPKPGGGSVSMAMATFGLALIHKGVTVSLKKPVTDSVRRQDLSNMRSRIAAFMASLSELADSDSRAFQVYLEACALPRATESERAVRKEVKEAGLLRATQIPLEAAAEMGRGLKCAEAAETLVDAHVRSDVLAGKVLLGAAIRSVLLSVDANLSGLSDATLQDSLRQQRNELEGCVYSSS